MKLTLITPMCIILLFAPFASAEQVQVEFSGVLTRVDQGTLLDGEVLPGTLFHGTYQYQDTVEDTNPENSEYGIYEFSVPYSQYIIHIDDYTFSAESYQISVCNQENGRDSYWVQTRTGTVSDGSSTEVWNYTQLSFGEAYGEPFDSDSLDQFVSLEDWGSTRLTLYPYHGGPLLLGDITSFEYVPEPVSLALLLVGGLAVVRRR